MNGHFGHLRMHRGFAQPRHGSCDSTFQADETPARRKLQQTGSAAAEADCGGDQRNSAVTCPADLKPVCNEPLSEKLE